MRHRKSGRKLNRNSPQRNALKKSLAISIIEHESVKTTLAKAKEIRGFLEPLVTLAKENTVANQRLAYSILQSKEAVAKLFKPEPHVLKKCFRNPLEIPAKDVCS